MMTSDVHTSVVLPYSAEPWIEESSREQVYRSIELLKVRTKHSFLALSLAVEVE